MFILISASIFVLLLLGAVVVITRFMIMTQREVMKEQVEMWEATHERLAAVTRETVEGLMGAASEALNRAVFGKEGEVRQRDTEMDRWMEEGQKWWSEDVDAMGQDPLDYREPDPLLGGGLGGLGPEWNQERAAGLRPGQGIPGIPSFDEGGEEGGE